MDHFINTAVYACIIEQQICLTCGNLGYHSIRYALDENQFLQHLKKKIFLAEVDSVLGSMR